MKPRASGIRSSSLNEQESDVGEPVAVLIDGQHFDADITELPNVGTTEAWYFQNLSEDAHPIHVQLVEFLLEDRQNIDVDRFKAYWRALMARRFRSMCDTDPQSKSFRLLRKRPQ